MILKKTFFSISLSLLLTFFLLKEGIISFLGSLALRFSPDGSIALHTLDTLYGLFIATYVLFVFFCYLLLYTSVLSRIENRIIAISFAAEYLIVLLVFANKNSWLQNPLYNVFTFLNMFQLLIAGIVCFFIGFRFSGKAKSFWSFLGLAFAYLSFDEIFELHEYLGNDLLFPLISDTALGRFISTFFLHPDDFILLLYVVAGLCYLFFCRRVFFDFYLRNPKALVLFSAGILLIFFQMISEKLVFRFLEESFEIFASLCFALSFYVVYRRNREK